MREYPLTNAERIKLEVLLSMIEIQQKMAANLQREYEMYLMTIFGKHGIDQNEFENAGLNLKEGKLKIKEEGDNEDESTDTPPKVSQPKNAVSAKPQPRFDEGSSKVQPPTTDGEGKSNPEPNVSSAVQPDAGVQVEGQSNPSDNVQS